MNPSFDQLQVAPELAVLAAVDRLLAVTAESLYAAQPELYDEGEHLSLRSVIAGHLVRDFLVLRKLIVRYQRAVADELQREHEVDLDGDLPF